MAVLGLCCAATSGVWGQEPPASTPNPARPKAAGRLVKMIDFEEHADRKRPDFDPDAVPQAWVRAQSSISDGSGGRVAGTPTRAGFPIGNEAGYDASDPPVAASGRCSVMLPTSGGSTALLTRSPEGLIPVFAGADYSVIAKVRTQGLKHARALLVARFLDQTGRAIEGAEFSSTPTISEGQWAAVIVQIPGRFPAAASLAIELQLLQPEHFAAAPIAPQHHVWPQDFSGAAWFDDITVTQLSRVSITTVQPSQIAANPDTPKLRVDIRDLTGEDMAARVQVQNAMGEVVSDETKRLGAGGGQFVITPSLPAYGWYEAIMQVQAAGSTISVARTTFVYAPKLARRRESAQVPGVGIDIGALPAGALAAVPAAIDALGIRSVTVPLWGPAGDASGAATRESVVRTMLDSLLSRSVQVTMSIDSVDEALALRLRLDGSDPLSILDRPTAEWSGAMRPMLDAYGQRISQWRIGSLDWPASLTRADFPTKIGAFRSVLESLVPGPRVVVPWGMGGAAWANLPVGPGLRVGAGGGSGGAGGGATSNPGRVDLLSLRVPPDATKADLTAWAANISGTGSMLRVALTAPAPSGAETPRDVADALMRRTLALWSALNTVQRPLLLDVELAEPWDTDASRIGGGSMSGSGPLRASPGIAVWRTVSDHLAGRRVAAVLPAPAGVHCLLLTGGTGNGALAVWCDPDASKGDSETSNTIEGYFGLESLTSVDVFGNGRSIERTDQSGKQRITPTPSPVIIEGVSPELTLFSLGVRIDPSFVPATAAEHEHAVVIRNPWPIQISGTLQLMQPSSARAGHQWTFAQASPVPFSIPAGGSASIPFSFSFATAPDAGPTLLPVQISLNADRAYPPMVIRSPLLIALPELTLTTQAVRHPGPNGPDVIVTASVTNSGSDNHSVEISAAATGRPQQAQSISNLPPGQTAVRRFVFKNAGSDLAGKRVRITLSDAETLARLGTSAMVPGSP